MQTFTIRFNRDDLHLVDTACLHPAPVEAFAFTETTDGRMEVSTVDKQRFDKWVKAFESNQRKYEIVH
jgi:hypothetical protein